MMEGDWKGQTPGTPLTGSGSRWFIIGNGYAAALWCRCGRRLYPDTALCPRCGEPVPKIVAEENVGGPPTPAPAREERKPQGKEAQEQSKQQQSRFQRAKALISRRRLIPLAAIAGLVAAIIAGAMLSRSRSAGARHPALQVLSAELTSQSGKFLVEARVKNPTNKWQEGVLAARFLDAGEREIFATRAIPQKFPPGETTAFLAADNHPEVLIAEVWVETK